MRSIFYFTATSLYMFRVPSAPIIRSTQNCNYSHWYKSYVRPATSLQRGQIRSRNLATLEWGSYTNIWLVPVAVTTVLCTPDDGCGRHPKHVEWHCSKIKHSLHTVASRTFINITHIIFNYFLIFLYLLLLYHQFYYRISTLTTYVTINGL